VPACQSASGGPLTAHVISPPCSTPLACISSSTPASASRIHCLWGVRDRGQRSSDGFQRPANVGSVSGQAIFLGMESKNDGLQGQSSIDGLFCIVLIQHPGDLNCQIVVDESNERSIGDQRPKS
jgi:hypothetical protein